MGDPAVVDIGDIADVEARRIGARRNHHRLHRQAVFAGEIEIALVMGRAAEDGAGAVFHEHEIGDIDRQLPVGIEGMDRLQLGAVALLLHRLQGFGRRRRLAAFLDEGGEPGIGLGELEGQRMVGRDRQKEAPNSVSGRVVKISTVSAPSTAWIRRA